MFIFEDMINMGLRAGQKWLSNIHKAIAIEVCIENPRVNSCEILTNNVQIINSIPIEEIRTVGGMRLIEMGCVI